MTQISVPIIWWFQFTAYSDTYK